MAGGGKVATASKTGKGAASRFVVDCRQMQTDNILDAAGLEAFFVNRIKVDGKIGNFERRDKKSGKSVSVVSVSQNAGKVIVETASPIIRKRYLKYLTKKYMSQQQIRDFLRVIATDKNTYQLRYYANAAQAHKTA